MKQYLRAPRQKKGFVARIKSFLKGERKKSAEISKEANYRAHQQTQTERAEAVRGAIGWPRKLRRSTTFPFALVWDNVTGRGRGAHHWRGIPGSKTCRLKPMGKQALRFYLLTKNEPRRTYRKQRKQAARYWNKSRPTFLDIKEAREAATAARLRGKVVLS